MNFNFIKSIILISRPINFTITFVAVIISGLLVSSNIDSSLIYAAFSLSFACAAGNIINDIFDLEIDKVNKPNRVLPSGKLSISQTYSIYFIFLAISLLLAFNNGISSILFLIIINILLYLYSAFLKKIILIGNITVAFLTSSALLYGAMVYENISIGLIPAGFAFLINLIREIIKDTEDITGDKQFSVITFPQKFGIKKSVNLSASLIIFIGTLSIFPFFFDIYKIEYFIIIMLLVNVLFVYSIKLLLQKEKNNSFSKVSTILKLNMIFGLIAIYAGS